MNGVVINHFWQALTRLARYSQNPYRWPNIYWYIYTVYAVHTVHPYVSLQLWSTELKKINCHPFSLHLEDVQLEQ